MFENARERKMYTVTEFLQKNINAHLRGNKYFMQILKVQINKLQILRGKKKEKFSKNGSPLVNFMGL